MATKPPAYADTYQQIVALQAQLAVTQGDVATKCKKILDDVVAALKVENDRLIEDGPTKSPVKGQLESIINTTASYSNSMAHFMPPAVAEDDTEL